MGKVIYHIDADYEKELISMWKAVSLTFDSKSIEGLKFEELLEKYLCQMYGSENINLEAISAVVRGTQSGTTVYDHAIDWQVIYGNLYTYVLLQGICIPYCDWIYARSYIGRDYEYFYENNTTWKNPIINAPEATIDTVITQQLRINELKEKLAESERKLDLVTGFNKNFQTTTMAERINSITPAQFAAKQEKENRELAKAIELLDKFKDL